MSRCGALVLGETVIPLFPQALSHPGAFHGGITWEVRPVNGGGRQVVLRAVEDGRAERQIASYPVRRHGESDYRSLLDGDYAHADSVTVARNRAGFREYISQYRLVEAWKWCKGGNVVPLDLVISG